MANNLLLASDNFVSGSLAAGWSAIIGLSKCQVIAGTPNVTEGNTVGTTAGQIWAGLTWPNDQTSEVTLGAALNDVSPATVGIAVRFNSSVQSGYLAVLEGNGQLQVFYDVAGTVTQIGSTVTGLTFAAGDVVSFQAAGSALTVYQNYKQIFYYYDTTYTAGSPGYSQKPATTLGTSQVSSWRGYSAVQQDGVWQKHGVVLAPIAVDLNQATAGTGLQCWHIFQDTNAQLLSGTVFKAWIVSDWSNDAASAMYYAESSDGIAWTRKAAAVLTGVTNGAVFKNGSTYYMYGQASGSSGLGNMLVYTSTDGINWTQQTPTSVLGLGAGGAWDATSFYNIISVAIVGGTWYGFYNGYLTGASNFSTGLATSTDGINWIKYLGNPVLANLITGSALVKVGGTWYAWLTAQQNGQGQGLVAAFEQVRYSSTDLITWIKSSHSLHRSQMFESLNAITGGANSGSILNVGSQTYFFYVAEQNDMAAPRIGQLALAIAPTSISNVVIFQEDGAQQIATDSFGEGAGALPAAWTTPTGGTALQIVAGPYVEPTVTSTVCQAVYTGASFSASQYSEITLHALTGTLAQSLIWPTVRSSTSALTNYEGWIASPSATSDAAAAIYKRVSGIPTQIGPTATIDPVVGDVFRLSVVTGSDGFPILSLFQNGFLILQVQDQSSTPITSGNPGIQAYSSVAIADAQIASWAGGNANVIPNYPGGGSLLLCGVGK